jgi:hypothetical protein
MYYIEQGNIDGAKKVLYGAYEGYFKNNDDYHTPWFKKHLDILNKKETNKLEKLEELSKDFRLKNRDSWVRSCQKGISKILGETKTDRLE